MFKFGSRRSSNHEEDLPRPLPAWIWVGIAAGAILFAAIIINWQFADHNIVSDVEKWGQVGDYFGGVLNPFLGFLTIVLLTASLRQNQIALQQTQEELKETRKAITQAEQTQAATEKALREQIEIADQARDMNNAVAICSNYREQYNNIMSVAEKLPTGSPTYTNALIMAKKLTVEVDRIQGVVDQEKKRLEGKYSQRA